MNTTRAIRIRDHAKDGHATIVPLSTPVGPIPGEELGESVKEISGIPAGVSDGEALERWNRVIDMTFLSHCRPARYTFHFCELSAGAILMP